MLPQKTKGFILGILTSSATIMVFNMLIDYSGLRNQLPVKDEDRYLLLSRTYRSTQQKASAKILNKPRILCWIMTCPDTLLTRAVHVKKTWGRRCDQTLFFSSRSNHSLPAIGLNTTEGRRHLWAKTKRAFLYIYKHYFDKADWFMKADDDTYVIVENLRHFLSKRNPKEAVYYGHQFKDSPSDVFSGYHSGGSGYVLSKEALRRFGAGVAHYKQACPDDGPDEDLRMGVCLKRMGVQVVNTSDEEGFITFFCFNIDLMIDGKYPRWYQARGVHSKQMGIGNFSRNAISFHYVQPWMMYTLEFFIYRFFLHSEFGDNNMYTLRQNNWIPLPSNST